VSADAPPAPGSAASVPVREDLGALPGYRSAQPAAKVRLNTNESPVLPPRAWVDALTAELQSVDFHRYPDRGAGRLRQALAEAHGVAIEQVYCANGSNEVLQGLLLAYGGPGRTAALFEPTYTLHAHIARVTGTAVAAGRRAPDFSIDLAQARRLLAEARPTITFLCSPNNPSGRAEPKQVVDEVVAMAPGLVVMDEAYSQFSRWSAIDSLSDEGKLVVVRTFSKTWSLAGVRLGYLVGPRAVVDALWRVTLPYHLDVMKQVAGALALRYEEEMHERVALIVAERERLSSALSALPVEAWPSEANFVLFRPLRRPAHEVWEGLLDRSVLIRECGNWPGAEGCLRVTVGSPEENDAFLCALEECLR
jgi:histidinol-phosphate aminotransferase